MSRYFRCFRVALLMLAPLANASQAASPYITLSELRTKYAANGHYAMIDGIQLYYRDEGQGQPILLVHGSASTSRQWDGVAAILAQHYRVIRYDVPGQGLSGNVADTQAQSIAPEDIAIGLLAKLGIPHVTCAGVSSGGTLCLYLAASRPDLVQRLIISDAPADPIPRSGLASSPALMAQIKIAGQTHFQDQAFWNAFLDFYAGVPARYSAQTRREFYDFNRRTPDKNAIALIAKVADHAKALQAFAAVRAPALLLWGARDELLPPQAAFTLQAYLKGAQVSVVFLPDAGHFPPMEIPARYAAIMTAYINDVTP